MRQRTEQEVRGEKAIGCHKHSQAQVSIAETQEDTGIVQVGTAKEEMRMQQVVTAKGAVRGSGLSKKGS